MSISFNKTLETVYKCLQQDNTISADIETVISVNESQVPHNDWQRFRKLPYDDLTEMREWLENVLTNEPPDIELAGLWFGLFNPVYENDEAVADIYICGGTEYDEDNMDWACDPEYAPDEGYAHSEILKSIYQIAYTSKESLGNDAEYPMCLSYGAFAIKRLLNEINPELLIKGDKDIGLAVGFDDGDYIILGKLFKDGLHLRSK